MMMLWHGIEERIHDDGVCVPDLRHGRDLGGGGVECVLQVIDNIQTDG